MPGSVAPPPTGPPSPSLRSILLFAALALLVSGVWLLLAQPWPSPVANQPAARSLSTPGGAAGAAGDRPGAPPEPPPSASPPPTALPALPPSATPLPTALPEAPTPTPGPVSARPTLVPPGVTPAQQLAPPGGLGNTRDDLVDEYGPPASETAPAAALFRRQGAVYRVRFALDPPRAVLIARPLPDSAPLPLQEAMHASRRLLPHDVRPSAERPEEVDGVVVERFHSPTVEGALPADLFRDWGGGPGQVLVVYRRGQQGAVAEIVVGIGDTPRLLLERARP